MTKTPGVSAAFRLFQGLGIEVIETNALENLASKIGASPAALKVTVEEFNNSVKDGKALEAKPAKGANAFKIVTPKFYTFYPLVPGITLTMSGIKVNTNRQALEPEGMVIPALYAAGECVGGLLYDDYWVEVRWQDAWS